MREKGERIGILKLPRKLNKKKTWGKRDDIQISNISKPGCFAVRPLCQSLFQSLYQSLCQSLIVFS